MKPSLKRSNRIVVALGLLTLGGVVSGLLWHTRPKAEKKDEVVTFPKVEVARVVPETVTFMIPSQGVIESDRRTRLAAEVAGRVIETADAFDAGGSIGKGEWLIRLDPVDYEAAIAQAASNLADARSSLASEQARSAQALRDWRNMGRGGDPPELVARKPQLESAEARVASAAAALDRAKKDLDRTSIRSPYDAIIASTQTEVGSYLIPGTQVAEIFATAPFEIRLPISIDEATFLPRDDEGNWFGEITLRANTAGSRQEWTGRLIRSEGEIDRSTRSLYLVAQIDETSDSSDLAIRPGLFLEAAIPARPLPDVLAIPFRAFRDLTKVIVVDENDQIRFREVSVLYRENEIVFARGGMEATDRVCLTELPDLIEGLKVDPVLVPLFPKGESLESDSIELTN
ncbi:MAG: efflux RND transporter periplasmic adaptor subunit [Verrucomicrobiota bacterium]